MGWHYILFSGQGCQLHDPHINPPGVGVKCPDDEINEQRTLRVITLSDHRAVYDDKCGRPQKGRGLIQCGHLQTGGGGRKGVVFCRRPL